MSIPMTTGAGLFTRLGHIIGGLNETNAYRGTTTIGPRVTTIQGDYTTTDQNLIDGLFSQRDSYRQVHSGWTNYFRTLAQNTVVQMVNDDIPQADKGITTAWNQVVFQMGTSYTLLQNVVSTPTATGYTATGTGTGVLFLDNHLSTGITAQYVVPETITVSITSDSSRGSTSYQEPARVTGQVSESDLLNWDWPLGSGSSNTTNAINFLQNNGTNLLTNGSMQGVSSSTLPNWQVSLTNASIVAITSAPTPLFSGQANMLQYTSSGTGTGSSFIQGFNNIGSPAGTRAQLQPLTVYHGGLWYYVSSVPAAGKIRVGLVDGNGSLTSNASGTANQTGDITISGATLNTWTFFPFSFQTPLVNPSTGYQLKISVTTGITSGGVFAIGGIAFTKAQQLYIGGPYFSLFSGGTAFVLNDSFTVSYTNTMGKFQKGLWQLFNIPSLQITPFTSGGNLQGAPFKTVVSAPTVSESLVV